MYSDLQINTYLADSDSDFSEFSSVESGRLKQYENKYRDLLRGDDGKKPAPPVKFGIHGRCKT